MDEAQVRDLFQEEKTKHFGWELCWESFKLGFAARETLAQKLTNELNQDKPVKPSCLCGTRLAARCYHRF